MAATVLGMKFRAHSVAREAVLTQTHTRARKQRHTSTRVRGEERGQDETERCREP